MVSDCKVRLFIQSLKIFYVYFFNYSSKRSVLIYSALAIIIAFSMSISAFWTSKGFNK